MSNNITLQPVNPPNLEQQVNNLIAKRKTWEDGIYRSATSALYELLADCLVIHQTVLDGTGADMELIKSLLKNRGFKFKQRTPILTNIVKIVFGDCGRRTEIYSYALEYAYKSDVAPDNFAQWVKANGGVESISELKHATTKSEKLSRVELIKIGQASVEQLPALAELPDLRQFQPSDNAFHQYSLALLRRTPTKNYSVVYSTAKYALIGEVFMSIGKDEAARHEELAIIEPSKTRSAKLRVSVQEAIATSKSSELPRVDAQAPSV